MFTIIDRYISKLFLSFFFGGIVVIMTLFLVIDFMGNVSRFNVDLSVLARYYSYYGFEILYQIIPVASLVGIIFSLSILNRRNELTSLYSFGMSLWRILRPVFLWILIFVVTSFYLGDLLLPVAISKGDYIFHVEMQKNPGAYSMIKANKIWYRINNTILNIGLLDAEKLRAFDIKLYYFSDDWKIQQVISAKRAKIEKDTWVLMNGTLSVMIEDSKVPKIKKFESKTVALSSQLTDLQTSESASELLSFQQLKSYISRNRDAGLDMTKFEVDLHKKLSFPFTIFVMSLAGVPFVINHHRSGGMAKNIALVLGMTIAFQMVYSVSLSMGRNGVIYPFLSAWGPNLLMLGFAIWMLRKKT